ncbi:MAG: hypothetical protein GF399_08390 [Candidatus Coatesbacteria bacterium]|nr:hypothetical protein [Candidatus Coatesbacteria bacterium]
MRQRHEKDDKAKARRSGLAAFAAQPLMGLLLLLVIAGALTVVFAVRPLVGWLALGVVVAFIVVRLLRYLRWRRREGGSADGSSPS